MNKYTAYITYYKLDGVDIDMPLLAVIDYGDDTILPSLVRTATRVGRDVWPKTAERMAITVNCDTTTVPYSQQGIKRGRKVK